MRCRAKSTATKGYQDPSPVTVVDDKHWRGFKIILHFVLIHTLFLILARIIMKVASLLLGLILFLGQSFAFVSSPLDVPKHHHQGHQKHRKKYQQPIATRDTVMLRRYVVPPQVPVEVATTGDIGLFVGITLVGITLGAYQEYRIDNFSSVKSVLAKPSIFINTNATGIMSDNDSFLSDDVMATAPMAVTSDESSQMADAMQVSVTPQESELAVEAKEMGTKSEPEAEQEPEPEPEPVPQSELATQRTPANEMETVEVESEVSPPIMEEETQTNGLEGAGQLTRFTSERLNDLVKQVGSTIEERRAMQELGQQRRLIESGGTQRQEEVVSIVKSRAVLELGQQRRRIESGGKQRQEEVVGIVKSRAKQELGQQPRRIESVGTQRPQEVVGIVKRSAVQELGQQPRRIESVGTQGQEEVMGDQEETEEQDDQSFESEVSEFSSSDDATTTLQIESKRKRVLRKLWRATKKVVAPWRKWKNIK